LEDDIEKRVSLLSGESDWAEGVHMLCDTVENWIKTKKDSPHSKLLREITALAEDKLKDCPVEDPSHANWDVYFKLLGIIANHGY